MKREKEASKYTNKVGNIHIIGDDKKTGIKKPKKLIIAVISITLAVMIAVFSFYTNINGAYIYQWIKSDVFGVNKGSGYPVALVGDTVAENNIGLLNRYVAYISDTTFKVLNSTAGEVSSSQHSYGNPAMRCADTKVITYDIGGVNYAVESTGEKVYNGSSDGKIYCASISESGIYGIASQTGGYLTNVQIFDKNNKLIYSYKMSECYAMGISINNAGTSCVVAGVDTSSGKLISKVYVLDFTKDKATAIFSFDDNLIFETQILDNGRIACIGDSNSVVIDIKNESYIEYKYGGRTLTSYSVKSNFGYALSLSPSEDGKECELVYVDDVGQVSYEVSTGLNIADIDIYSKRVSAYSKGNIYLFDKNGEILSETECSKDVKSILMLNDSMVYTIGVTEIKSVDVTR